MNLPEAPRSAKRKLTPARIALLYAAFAALWIVTSSAFLTLAVDDPVLQGRIEMGKGALFVLVTSGLLYLVLGQWHDHVPVTKKPDFGRFPVWIWRVTSFVVLAAVVPSAGYLVVKVQRPQIEREVFSNLEAIARLKVDQVENWVFERQNDGVAIMASSVLIRQVEAMQQPGGERLRESVSERLLDDIDAMHYEEALLVDAHGRALIEFGSFSGLPPNTAALVPKALETFEIQQSSISPGFGGQLNLDLVVPLIRQDEGGRRPVGAVILRIKPERFLFPSIQHWPTASPSGETLLVRRVGDSVVYVNKLRHRPGSGLSLSLQLSNNSDPAVAAVLADHPGNMQGKDYRGVPVLASYRSVAGTDWVIVTKLDRDEVIAPVKVLAFWVSLIAFVAISTVAAVTLLLWRQRSRMLVLEMRAESNRLMQQLYDLPFIGISMTSPETRRWVRCNDRFCEIMGYSREEILNLSWRDLTSPEDMAISEIENEQVMRGESDGFKLDKRFVRKDGSTVYASVDLRCVRRADGSPEYILAMFQDITERKAAEAREHRLTRTYAALSECNQLIVRCRSRDELFSAICRIAVELGGMKMAWVGTVDPETRQVTPVASFGEGTEWLDGIQVSSDAQIPFGRGATGTCVRECRPVWVDDFLHEPMTAPWHERARNAGWSSSCALPLDVDGTVVGAFMLYSGERAAFDDTQRELLIEMAADISFALANLAREEARQLAEARLNRLTQMYSALSECNQAIVRCDSEEELFRQVCRVAVQYGGMKMAWIGRIDRNARCVIPVARFGEGVEHLDGVAISIDATSPLGLGALGTAIRERRLVVVDDYLNDRRTAPWRERAVEAGWKGAAAVPLTCKDDVVGGLALLAGEANAFDIDIRRLLSEMALDISFALDMFAREVERRRMEEQLRLTAKVFEQGGEGIMITDDKVNIMTVNRAFEVITGYAQDEVIGRNPRFLSSARHDRDFFRAMWEAIDTGGFWQGEIWNRRKDGDVYPEYLSVSRVVDGQGRVTNYVGTFNDISESKASQEHIQRLAHYDSLTGLPNRILLADRVNLALNHMERSGEPLALIFLDLDRFKNVNDSLGHRVGDELLIQVAQRLKDLLREDDTVSRLGGDEFILVLPAADEDGAGHVAGKVLKALSEPYYIEQYELAVTASMGIAMYPDDGTTYEALSMCADTAMYRAKQSGRQTFRFFTREMQERSDRTLLLENALRRALELDQLRLHFQPQVSLESGRVIGVEALLRWTHPELGEVAPADFIPVAEDCGMILPIGEWVLRSAARQMREWLDRGVPPLVMAVNLSAIQFRQANLPQLVSQILDEEGLPPGLLELELTEGVAMENPLEAIAVMNDLHGRGVRMSIDDFGTGYSSLSYLKRFKVYKLKIDKSFVRDISRDPEDEAIVEAIIGMAESLGLQTIAEGVETDEQSTFLLAKGCNEGQGYLYGRPMPAEEFEQFARTFAVAPGGR